MILRQPVIIQEQLYMKTFTKALMLLGVIAAFAFAQGDDNTQKAFIKTMVGTVEVSSTAVAKWKPARAGMMVKMGWSIRTYIESSADVEIETGTLIRVGENSVVTLSKMLTDKQAGVTSSDVKVATGKIWANVKKLTNTKSEFEFETPTAVASIRGTKLGLAVDKDGTQLDVYEGLVVVRPRGGAGKEVAVSTRNRAVINGASHAIQVIQFTEKDTLKGQKPMKDPFADTTGASKKIDKLLDTAGHSAVDTSQQAPLVLDISQPVSGAVVKETPVLIKGKASINATVEVAGKEVVVDKQGMFSALVDLNLGKNSITITAKRGGSSKTAEGVVEYHPPLVMNVTNIIDNMEITSSDLVVDVEVNDGAKFSVNGRENATKVSLTPGKNTITVRAWDQWNTVMEKTFIVNYTKTGVFVLNVVSPKDQSALREPMIPVSGSTTPGAKVTVNGTPVTVTASGFFTYTMPIPDEAQEYTVRIVSRLGDDEATDERSVSYSPPRAPLTLQVITPVDGQVIRTNVIHVSGKTGPRAKVNINNRPAAVTAQGTFTYDIQLTERDIGDYTLDVTAADDSSDLVKMVNLKIDGSSQQINTSFPTLTVPMLNQVPATRVQKMLVNVYDKTPEDQITLVILNNSVREELTFDPGDQQYFNLEEGKNTFSITAYDRAKNPSNTVQGTIYYLPGPLSIDLVEPSDNVTTIDDLPPMPKGYGGSKMNVQVEINDGIRNVPETIRYVRITDNSGRTVQMLDKQNYKYVVDVPLSRGYTSFLVTVQDIANNIGTKKFDVNIR
jgi:hypothetical protein